MSFMKKTKYEVEKICAFCEKSEKIFDDDNMLCEKYGIVPCTYKCRSFSYDPLKRVPPRTPKRAKWPPRTREIRTYRT